MPAPFSIGTPSVRDYPELLRVWEASVRATHAFLPTEYIDELRVLMQERYLDVVMLICVRDQHKRIVGFAGVAAGRVEMLFIDPLFLGQGLGKRLLWYAVEHLNAEALDVNEQNAQAIGFYFSQGFEVVGRSAFDGMGQPFPLLHLRLTARPARSA
ncbi:GNAT family N-acetyltransferase [Pseudomonas sp. RIT-PI-S]|uniref:GNAT family N-acetyltransferase n=1 Tax=Pseudomonas sp. RIT-PI-S TaxID=3035295 RepID=UPI0021DAED79|nr:GNAT family N-acetyltransferase [Pseudomonas sp. RIT-PI-S]